MHVRYIFKTTSIISHRGIKKNYKNFQCSKFFTILVIRTRILRRTLTGGPTLQGVYYTVMIRQYYKV